MIELRTPAEIEAMRPAGRFVADVLERLATEAHVGVNLLELDRIAAPEVRLGDRRRFDRDHLQGADREGGLARGGSAHVVTFERAADERANGA